ncbi:hypothetical protein LTR91_013590 [Friedmanniomyces endolithicus]|uniref:TMEM205-like domain-containing protein n=1 Tax=Friedmanniomyces endolithicus TaxID=329885 RepID=A0AAN6KDJ7_9PEZI|nr:hypothetical protein LTR38_006762 [Friedmanniomyces endolithicus]KAK0906579.1 hypothetical protein LTR02_005912 [Friedmanniomyces endolithicus]KAK0914327.1 hypothetical protein LTR57_014019 [Friedmanniomyces endolithicus]KAK0976749.1 hypothetical protein LTR91_013590 [Friedmanniomyces endolithicus]KAK1007170.1 hypothetical protein LTS01_002864 [Friedmanniomyces endolithicus]
MPSTASLTSPTSYHLLTYGTLLGSNLFQTFLNGPVAYTALPRPQFSTLQQAIFPPYFTLQTLLPLVLALTWPGDSNTTAALGLRGSGAVARQNAGYSGLLAKANFWDALVPIAMMFGTSLLNLAVLGPATTRVMRRRKHQETRDGKRYYEAGPKSEEMQKLNSSFTYLHSAASLSNLVGTGAMILYGFVLAEKM